LKDAFADIFTVLLKGDFGEIEGVITHLIDGIQKQFSELFSTSMLGELQKLLTSGGMGEADVLGGAGGFLREFAAELENASGDVAAAFSNLSAESLATAQAMAQAAGMMAGTAIAGAFGATGPKAQMGSSVGGMVGGVGGAAVGTAIMPGVGTVVGGFAGSMIGSAAGGMIGGLFDEDAAEAQMREFRTKLSQSLEQAASEGMGAGLKHAMETGDISGGIAMLSSSLEDAMKTALINAFVNSVIMEGALRPMIQNITQTISGAVQAGFSPESMGAVKESMAGLRATLQSSGFREMFSEAASTINDVFAPGMAHVAESTAATAESMAAVAEHSSTSADASGQIANATQQAVGPATQLQSAQAAMANQYMPAQVAAWDQVLGRTQAVGQFLTNVANTHVVVPIDFDTSRAPKAPAFVPGDRGFALGGLVTRPTRALIGEAGFPEIVLGPPSRQAFAREFAAAVADSLEQMSAVDESWKKDELQYLKRMTAAMERSVRSGGRLAGAAV
jgi:hypothetical protein